MLNSFAHVLEEFQDHLQQTHLLTEGCTVLVAYSGGSDSTCLLSLLKATGIDVVAAHLDHQQRPESQEEQARCQAFCEGLDVPFISGKADVPKLAEMLGLSMEEAGRRARKDFLGRAREGVHAQFIATGHTRDDHIETMLFRMARGTGIRGLRGILAQDGVWIRPLLPFTKAETRAYCLDRGLWFHDDPANDDLDNARSRLRHRVVPELELVHLGFPKAMIRLSEVVAEEDDFLDSAAAAGLERAEIPLNGNLRFLTERLEVQFATSTLRHLPPVLLRRALRLAFQFVGGEPSFEHIRLLVEGLQSGISGSVTLEGGLHVAEWDSERVHLRSLKEEGVFRHTLPVPTDLSADALGWRLTADLVRSDGSLQRSSLQVEVRREVLKTGLYFRSVQPGDKIDPLGFDGHRKLTDLLSEAGLTLMARQRLPIICDGLGPIWAPNVCLSGRIAAQLGEEAVKLTFGPL